jgi:hypothetical protein
MKTSIAYILVAVALLLGFERAASADGKRLVVVVAKGSQVTNISRSDLRRCFTGEKVSPGGNTLIPFNASPNTPERVGFDEAVLGMSPDEVGRFWIDRKVRGESSAPRSLPSSAHVAKVAAKFPNAIGYLPEDALTSDIQAVAVDGVPYTDAHYNILTR